MKEYLDRILGRNDLSQSETEEVFDLIMSGSATPAQIGGFMFQHRNRIRLRHRKLHPVPGSHIQRKNLRVDFR